MTGFIVFIIAVLTIIFLAYKLNKENVKAIDEKNDFIFDEENFVKIEGDNLTFNNEKNSINKDEIEHVKFDRVLQHLFFTRTNMFVGALIFLLFLSISYIILKESVSNPAWVVLFISSFITGGLLGGLKKKYLNSYIYFFLKDDSVKIITVAYKSTTIGSQLKTMELFREKLRKIGVGEIK